MSIDAQIEAILFFKAEPMKTMRLAELLSVDEEAVREGVTILSEKLQGRGVTVLLKDDEVSLGTVPDMGETIEKIIKDELHRDLGNAAIETLTIILYKGPLLKSEIDFIRGVNSNFILRNLLVRGLVEKVPNPIDQRSFLYRPTFDLLAHLGINRIEDLPEFEEFRIKVEESIEQFSHPSSHSEQISSVDDSFVSLEENHETDAVALKQEEDPWTIQEQEIPDESVRESSVLDEEKNDWEEISDTHDENQEINEQERNEKE